jgi:hypothetical protein
MIPAGNGGSEVSDLPFWVAIPVVALLIPIAAIVADAVKKIKEREHMHLERLKAIEMGMPEVLARMAPEDPAPAAPKKNGRNPGRHGAVWTGVGAGLLAASIFTLFLADNGDFRQFGIFLMFWALPSLGVGISLLIYDAKVKRDA